MVGRRHVRSAGFGFAIVGASLLTAPAAAVAAAPASAEWFADGPGSYGGNGYVDSDSVTFQAYGPPPFAEIGFQPDDRVRLLGVQDADDTAVAVGTYADARFPKVAGHPYFFTYDAQLCWNGSDRYGVGSYVVHEVAFDGSGLATKLAVDLTWHCNGETKQHYRALRFNSTVSAAFLDVPTDTDFGTTSVGVAVDRTITITNSGTTSVHVTGAALGGADPTQFGITTDGCAGIDLAVSDTCDVVVHAHPTQIGVSHATLTISSNAIDAQLVSALVQSATQSTAVSLELSSPVVAAGAAQTVTATVTPVPVQGWVDFFVDGLYGGANATVDSSTGVATASLPGVPFGTHDVTAHFFGQTGWDNSVSDPQTLTAKHGTTVTLSSSRNPAPAAASVTLTATIGSAVPSSGTLTLVDETTSTTLGSGPVGAAVNSLSVVSSFAALGTHVIRGALVSDDPDYLGSTGQLDQVIAVDTVIDATGLSTSATSIYPYHDGYRDTLAVRGSRTENLSVTITVRNSGGSLVARGVIPSGMGVYSWTWTGKTSSGAILAAGTYKITQVLHDQSANSLTWSKSVALSTKRLYTYTFGKTLNGNQFQSYGKTPSAAASVTKRSSPYANEVRIHATSSAWAAVEYSFTLPSATVSKSLRLYATAKSYGNVLFLAWNPSLGSYLNVGTYDTGRYLGTSYGTYGFAAAPSTHISSHHVHAMVYCGYPQGAATSDIAKVKVVFVYGILK